MSRPTGAASERTAGRRTLAKMGLALPDGGFPVGDAGHWDKARQAIGRVKNPQRRAAVARLLRKTAARYGRTKQLQESWAAPRAAHAHASTTPALEFAVAARMPVTSPFDLVISRGPEGEAIVRHRRGGYEIGRIKRGTDGAWMASAGGHDMQPRTRQRAALLELIGVHNKGTTTPYRRAEPGVVRAEPLQPPPAQTALMEQYGIPAIRALATPAVAVSDGPRTTGNDISGLSPRAQGIYKKLRGRNFPHPRALNFAKRAAARAERART